MKKTCLDPKCEVCPHDVPPSEKLEEKKCCDECNTWQVDDESKTRCVNQFCKCHKSAAQNLEDARNSCTDTIETLDEKIINYAIASQNLLLQDLLEAVEGMKVVNTKEESDTDWFYGYGYNSAISEVVELIRKKME